MATDKIKKDENTALEVSRVPSKNPKEQDDLDLKENPDTETLQQKSDRERSQGNETIGIP